MHFYGITPHFADSIQSNRIKKHYSIRSVDGAVEPADGIQLVNLRLINICGQ